MARNGARKVFFRLIQTLPTIWATWMKILRIFMFDGSVPCHSIPHEHFWDLEIQKFGIQKMKKIKILKIQIRSAQNVGKVWISMKKSSRPYLGPSEAIFSMDRKNPKNAKKKCLFSLVDESSWLFSLVVQ